MKALRARLALVCALGTGLLACGEDAVSTETRSIAQGVCDLAFRCCTTGEAALLLGPFTSPENCEDRLQNRARLAEFAVVLLFLEELPAVAIPNIGVMQEAIDDGRLEVDEDALDTCLDFLADTECAVLEEEEEVEGCEPPEIPPEEGPCDLDLIFSGNVGEDEDCSSPDFSLECKKDLVCIAVDSLGVDGVCARPGMVGDFCFSDTECHEDLYCSPADGTCQEFAQEGEVCAFGDADNPSPGGDTLIIECDAELGLSCDPVTDRCVAPCQLGAVCSDEEDCDAEQGLSCILGRCDRRRPEGLPCSSYLDCQEGLRCAIELSTSQFVCQPRLDNGQPCSVSCDANPDQCECKSGYCNPMDDPDFGQNWFDGNNVCSAPEAPGAACHSRLDASCSGGYCQLPAATVSGCTSSDECSGASECLDDPWGSTTYCAPYCIAAQPNGSDCTSDPECDSGACVAGKCRVTPLPDGRACDFDDDCESMFCSLEGTCETPPLPNGTLCSLPTDCESGVCFEGTCRNGLQLDDDCSDPTERPCAPELYCEDDGIDETCQPRLGPGEACEGSFQCIGTCTVAYGRPVCDGTVGPEEAFCDGEE